MTLDELFARYQTDKHEHGYAAAYERHLGPLRDEVITLLEIGVWRGGSLLAWADWMPKAQIIGVDINPQLQISAERIHVEKGDIKQYAPDRDYDVIIDDGSHFAEDIMAGYLRLWPKVKPGGWWICEDLDTQEPNSSVIYQIEATLRELWHEQGDVAELHGYPQLCFLRKR